PGRRGARTRRRRDAPTRRRDGGHEVTIINWPGRCGRHAHDGATSGAPGRDGRPPPRRGPGRRRRGTLWHVPPANDSTSSLARTAAAALTALPPAVLDLGSVFADAGHELALVGGPVRDAFLGSVSHDLDFATSARPDDTERLLARWADAHWDVGKEFGTIGARKGDVVVEVTTYRTEAYEAASRKPVVEYGDTLEGDLTRRDFTVNAMAVTLPSLTFVDPHGGLEDLRAGVLRTPVDPEQSFDDDPLRIMRAVRFTAQLRFDVEAGTMAAMSAIAD